MAQCRALGALILGDVDATRTPVLTWVLPQSIPQTQIFLDKLFCPKDVVALIWVQYCFQRCFKANIMYIYYTQTTGVLIQAI